MLSCMNREVVIKSSTEVKEEKTDDECFPCDVTALISSCVYRIKR